MRLKTSKIAAFVIFQYIIPDVESKIFDDQKCQPITPEDHFRPPYPHVTLSEDYLRKFKETIIIGDNHRCYDEQQLLINRHKLNDTVLKIFTGDLTRKGNKNIEVLRSVKNCKSCLSVRGNNDEKTLLLVFRTKRKPDYSFASYDKWMEDLTEDDINYLKKLPYSFYLPSMNSRVCHAGFLPGGVHIEENRPYTIMNIRTLIADPKCPGGWRPTRQEFLYNTSTPTFAWASQWRGPEHIYFGHDHSRQLQLYPFATGVDTACVKGHYMTGLFIRGPRKGTFVTQPALKQYYHGKV